MKKLQTSTESDLLKAREEGLRQARSLDTMQAHGKWRGMDVFSWGNPHFDALSNVIDSFPFPVVWVGKHEQVKCATTYYPEVLDALENVIVFDQGNLKIKVTAIEELDKVAGVGDLQSALEFVKALGEERRVFLFTTEGDSLLKDLSEFKSFIEE